MAASVPWYYSTRKHSQKKRKETVTLSFLITIWNLQLKQLTFDEDHNIHTYSLFCSVVSAVENSRKPLLLVTYRNQVFLYFSN